ncbi:MAG: 50S ribosomal protein L18 [Myxococcota bacterium]|nr:50S ribosomal protein L18 [Myxococcales bacterium]
MQKRIRNEDLRRRLQRRKRIAKRVAESERPSLTVFRSAKHIYAQVVDPQTGRTLFTVSTRQKGLANGSGATGNVEAAKRVGAAVAAEARKHDITRVVFNRNGFLYHGRVKALADAAREGGLEF